MISWLLGLALCASAATFDVQYGLGASEGLMPTTQEKLLGLHVHDELKGPLKYGVDIGGFTDRVRNPLTGYFFTSIGPELEIFKYLTVRNMVGVGAITHTDDLLGSHLQFLIDLGVGFTFMGGRVGLNVKHISNAGIKQPNFGRNFWLLSFGYGI